MEEYEEKVKKIIKEKKIYDCKDLKPFINSIKSILPYRGYSASHFFMNKENKIQFITKLNFYRKDNPELYGTVSKGTVHQNTAEIKVLELLKKEIIDKKISPCIIRILYHVDCTNSTKYITPGDKLCGQYRKTVDENLLGIIYGLFCRNLDLIRSGISNDRFSFVTLEEGNITFRKFLTTYVNNSFEGVSVFKTLLFQIIFTFYQISKKYPSFRHYDLHTDNIMLKFDNSYIFNPIDLKFLIFTNESTHWAIPYFGVIVKIIDFGFTVIKEEKIISNVIDNKMIMHSRPDNDILFLLNLILLNFINILI